VIADYERRNFSVSQCKWDAAATQNIHAILPPSNRTNSSTIAPGATPIHSLPIVAIAGGAGGVVILVIALLVLFILLRRKRKAKKLKAAENTSTSKENDETIIKAELDGQDHKARIYENAHEVDGNDDRKWLAEVSGQEVAEIDSHGRKWPPTAQAVEIGSSGRTSPIYEMAAEEVAIEMPGIAKAKRKSEVGRPMSFTAGDDTSPREPVSASSGGNGFFYGYRQYRRDGTEVVSPASEGFSP
jgi:hypothetical protein